MMYVTVISARSNSLPTQNTRKDVALTIRLFARKPKFCLNKPAPLLAPEPGRSNTFRKGCTG